VIILFFEPPPAGEEINEKTWFIVVQKFLFDPMGPRRAVMKI
jgi:hypothetical protein